MALQSGVNSAESPSAAPGSVTARTTSTRNAATSKGMKILFARSMPCFTPRHSTPSTTAQIRTRGIATPGTSDPMSPGDSATRR